MASNKKNIININKKLILFLIFTFIILSPSFCYAVDNLNTAFEGTLKNVAGSSGAGYDTSSTGKDAYQIISLVITTALGLLGVIFLVLMIYAGYNWMTARGEEEKVTKAKDTIIRAIIGLIIVVAAYAISIFVMASLGTATLK